jgi:membrane protease YdiL (CAAX protease family)
MPENPEAPPYPAERRWIAGIAVSWFLILAAIFITQIPQYRNSRYTDPDATRDVSMELIGKYIVGMKAFLGKTPEADIDMLPLLRKIAQGSDNPRKYLSFIPIVAELTTREKALEEFERFPAIPAGDPAAKDVSLFKKLYQSGSASLTQQQYSSIERYGWVGKLALSQDMEASDPLRRSVVRSALRTFLTAVIFTISGLLALIAGLMVGIIGLILLAKKQLHVRFSAPETPRGPLLEAFAIYISGSITLPILVRWLYPDYTLAASFMLIPVIVLALFWLSFRGLKWKDIRAAIGWHRGQGIFREIAAGILGYLAGLPLLFLALIPALKISRSTGRVPAHPIVQLISANPITLILMFGLICLWAPVVEETFFRGMLFGYLRRRLHWIIAGIVTGFVFAVIHPQGWVAVPALGAIGFTLSAIREWRGSIIAPMTAHALNNGAVFLFAVLALT